MRGGELGFKVLGGLVSRRSSLMALVVGLVSRESHVIRKLLLVKLEVITGQYLAVSEGTEKATRWNGEFLHLFLPSQKYMSAPTAWLIQKLGFRESQRDILFRGSVLVFMFLWGCNWPSEMKGWSGL